jgi:hypothetical protein
MYDLDQQPQGLLLFRSGLAKLLRVGHRFLIGVKQMQERTIV